MAPQPGDIIASLFTGAAVILLTNPLDTVKNRYQVAKTRTGVLAFGAAEIKRLGLLRALWFPGLATNCTACTMTVGVRIGLYPSLRDAIAPNAKTPGAMAASGLVGGALGYTLAAPFFHATRLAQVSEDGLFGLRALRRIVREGIAYRGAGLLIARGATISTTQLTTYDSTKGFCRDRGLEDGPAVHVLCSVAASLAVTTAMVPLDVTLTHYQTSASPSPLACARDMYQTHGPRIFVRGWLPLWARFLPSSVLTFVIYEQARKVLVGEFLK